MEEDHSILSAATVIVQFSGHSDGTGMSMEQGKCVFFFFQIQYAFLINISSSTRRMNANGKWKLEPIQKAARLVIKSRGGKKFRLC